MGANFAHAAGGPLTRAEFLLFQELIGRASGLQLEERDWTPLRAALCERVASLGDCSFGEYYELLRSPSGAREMGKLVELLTVHETAFFRNRPQFDALVRRTIPELLERNAGIRSLRLWSAGCSTGQEAYSMAISLLEAVPDPSSWRLEVLATDISNRALEIARRGVYPERAIRNVDPVLLDRYFQPCDGGYELREAARQLVRFEHLNLVKEPFPLAALRPFDLVFCENVTIYFKVESTRRVIRNFFDVLRGEGYLFLGYSETLWNVSNDFMLKEVEGAFVYQKPLEGAGGSGVGKLDLPATGSPGERAVEEVERVPLKAKRSNATSRSQKRGVTLEKATAYYESRRFEEALLAVEELLLATPTNVQAQLLAAKLRADREEIGPALRHCSRVLELDPLQEEAHYLTGVLQLRNGGVSAATQSFARVIYLKPVGHRSALAHFHMAGLFSDEGDLDGALREYRSALRLFERFPKDELLEEFSADFLARVCLRRLEELGRGD